MNPVLADEHETVRDAYAQARTRDHLDAIVAPLLVKHGLKLRFDEVVYHDDLTDDKLQQIARTIKD